MAFRGNVTELATIVPTIRSNRPSREEFNPRISSFQRGTLHSFRSNFFSITLPLNSEPKYFSLRSSVDNSMKIIFLSFFFFFDKIFRVSERVLKFSFSLPRKKIG